MNRYSDTFSSVECMPFSLRFFRHAARVSMEYKANRKEKKNSPEIELSVEFDDVEAIDRPARHTKTLNLYSKRVEMNLKFTQEQSFLFLFIDAVKMCVRAIFKCLNP